MPQFADRWLICATHGTDIRRYTAIEQHLNAFRKKLEKRSGAGKNYQWFELQSGSREKMENLNHVGVIFQEISSQLHFCFKEAGIMLNNKCYIIIDIQSSPFLLGILNTFIVQRYLQSICPVLQNAYSLGEIYVRRVPIPDATPAQRRAVEELVQKILKASPKAREALERELDAVVAGLYGL